MRFVTILHKDIKTIKIYIPFESSFYSSFHDTYLTQTITNNPQTPQYQVICCKHKGAPVYTARRLVLTELLVNSQLLNVNEANVIRVSSC